VIPSSPARFERGTLEFEVRSRKGNTTLDRIARSVQEAQGQRAPTQRFIDRFAGVYAPAVFALAVLMAIIPPLFSGVAWYDWAYKALVLLVTLTGHANLWLAIFADMGASLAVVFNGLRLLDGSHPEDRSHAG